MKVTFDKAVDDALMEEMHRDERVLYLATNPPQPLLDQFGSRRVRRTPIAESAMTGMAVGAAGCGYRPVINWGNVTFSFGAFDQIANQAARIRYMSGGQRDFPIVFYARFANGYRIAAQHCQSGFAFYAHAAGLKVVAPSNAEDAKGLMKASIRDNNPVVFVYAERLSSIESEVPDGEHLVSFGSARTITSGGDATIVGIGYMALIAEQAAKELADEGIFVDVIDPRTLVPLDIEAIRQSVRRTGRLVVVDESFPTCSVASEIIAAVVEDADSVRMLRAPIKRVCTAPVPMPFSPPLEDFVLPGVRDVKLAVQHVMAER